MKTQPLRRLITRFTRIGLPAALLVALLASAVATAKYKVPERSDEELALEAKTVCLDAVAKKQPVLLEFSAPWCTDCKEVDRLKHEPALRDALSRYGTLTVNVGKFDRHQELLKAFDVRAIAHWVVLVPERCEDPLESWRRTASRTLEPLSGDRLTAAGLARWLEKMGGTTAP
jgi:thiol:disulfide interchange protein